MPHKQKLPEYLLSVVDSHADRSGHEDATNRELMVLRLAMSGGERGDGT